MLRKIPVSQLCVGMYVHELSGSWLDHPFWRSRFLMDRESDLRRLLDSGIEWVWIDTERGIDVPDQVTPTSPAQRRGGAGGPRGPKPLTPEARAYARALDLCEVARDRVTQMFTDAGLGKRLDLGQIQRLAFDMAQSIEEHPDALTSLARIKRADQYTYMHSVAVGALMTSFARSLGLAPAQVHRAGTAGLLHDIGKVRIDPAILNKPGRLTADEFTEIKKHPAFGEAILREDDEVPPEVLDVVRHHHERFDGKGYPDALPVEQVPQLVRMASLCDVYDAVTSNRPYKKGWDPAFALNQMQQMQGQFDPEILQAFIATVGRYPIGSIVSLTDNELGLVVAQNPGAAEQPVLKVFYSVRHGASVPVRRVDLSQPGCPTAILPVVNAVDWAQSNLPVPPVVG